MRAFCSRAGKVVLLGIPLAGLPLLLCLVLLSTLFIQALPAWPVQDTPASAGPMARPDFGNLPLSFVPNAGQTDPAVHFTTQAMGGTLFFTSNEVVLSLPTPGTHQTVEGIGPSDQDHLPRFEPRPPGVVVRLQFEGANQTPEVSGIDSLPGTVNYVLGNDRAKWRTNLPSYAATVYRGLYPGIDLRYDGADGRLKGTYAVAPGADPDRIHWRYRGARSVRIDENTGDLLVEFAGGRRLTEMAPVGWQNIDGRRVPVPVRYKLAADGGIGFDLGRYDVAYPLILDPTLVYSTLLGGSGDDRAQDVAVDGNGNVYVVGYTSSGDFPANNPIGATRGGDDAFVVKLNAAGSEVLYSTFLGGSQRDRGHAIAVDNIGNVYVAGDTGSSDFSTANPLDGQFGGSSEGFVAKLNASGDGLVYSTFLGGSGGSGAEASFDIAVDSAGNAYITGYTDSRDFPTANARDRFLGGVTDAFVTKLNADGTAFLYSTYLGGWDYELGASIAVDNAGRAYVTGDTSSANFPLTNAMDGTIGGPDGFVTKLSPSGASLVFSTFLGGSRNDNPRTISVDGAGNSYVTGWTDSVDFPTAAAFDSTHSGGLDGFVSKLSASGASLVFSTFLGGSGHDSISSSVVDPDGNIYVAGHSSSGDYPMVHATDGSRDGEWDGFVSKLHAGGNTLLFSTYLGGSDDDFAQAITLDNQSNVYIAGITGSADYPTANAISGSFAGEYDAFVVKLSDPRVVDNTSYAIRYDGWTGVEDAAASGGGYRRATSAGQTMSFRTPTPATELSLITYRGPNQGLVQITIDGVDRGTFDLYAATPEYRYLVTFGNLSLGLHTMVVKVRGEKHPASTSTQVRVDGIAVGGTTFEDIDELVRHNLWSGTAGSAEAVGGSYRYATRSASASFSFTGSRFTWLTARGPAFGQAQVFVDGIVVASVDLYNPSIQWRYQQVIDGLAPGKHSVTIKVLGTRNSSSTGTAVVVDAVSIP